MSNVLIGIIGVILFIGLALAGALFLGPRFQESSNTSKAASVVAGIQQVQSAISLYRVESGDTATMRRGPPTSLVPTYLKSIPVNPSKTASTPYWDGPVLNNDPYPDTNDEGGAQGAKYVVTVLGRGPQAQAICQAVADQTSGGVVTHFYDGKMPTERIGCWWHDTSTTDPSPNYVVYGTL